MSYTKLPVVSGGGGGGSGDMLASVYDPANGARQVAFADELGYEGYDYFANLPANPDLGSIFIVRNPTTTIVWLVFTKITYQAGFYRWNGSTYDYLGNSYDNLSELNDVALSSLTANDFLGWDSVNTRWVNKQITGFELSSNKSTNTALGNSDTLYPSQKAVKDYVDGEIAAYVPVFTPAGNNHEIQYNDSGTIGASPNMKFDADTITLEIGQPTLVIPDNPLNLRKNVDSYVQTNLQNTSSGVNASSDVVATADNGNDTVNYVDVGINSSTFNSPSYPNMGPNDTYEIGAGGHHHIVASSIGKKIKFSTSGFAVADQDAEIDTNGINIPSDRNYRKNGEDFITIGTTAPATPYLNQMWIDTN